MNYLGIDIGTSGCKSVVFDENGVQLALAIGEYDAVFSDDGGAELDSNIVIQNCFDTIRECSGQVTPNSIVGLGISSQGEAFTAIGSDGQALSQAMISSDTRSEAYMDDWIKKVGQERLYQLTGHTAHPMFTLFKLIWLKHNKVQIWQDAIKFFCFEDLLQFRLGIDPAISWSLAGRTMLFDVVKHEWNHEILDLIGLNKNQLARPLAAGNVAGKLDQQVCRRLGFAEGAIVVSGGHDQPCGALGAGVTRSGMAMYATGSVECITPGFDKPVFSEDLYKNNLCTYDHVVKDMYVTVAFSLTGGNILKWFRDEFGFEEVALAEQTGANAYELLLKKAGNIPSNLLVLPYFTASGTPYFDTRTKGAVLGLRLSTNRGEYIRALLEGVALEMRLNLDILEKSGIVINELRAIGGGSRSESWTQLKADITGRKITTLRESEAGCLGVAMLICSTYTGQSIREIAKRWVKTQTTIHPDPNNKKLYDKRFESYKKLYGIIKELNF